MKISPDEALKKLAEHEATFLTLFQHGTLRFEIYKPEKEDYQKPHSRDEMYVIVAGTGEFVHEGVRSSVAPGDFLFVPARDMHRFENFSDDFATWVFFYGPVGGEKA